MRNGDFIAVGTVDFSSVEVALLGQIKDIFRKFCEQLNLLKRMLYLFANGIFMMKITLQFVFSMRIGI